MNEYRRFISYIYAYPGNVKDKNVGFVKIEVRNGQCRLDMSLNGVYMDTSRCLEVFMMVRDYALVKVGEVIVNGGKGKYRDLLNPDNINGSGFSLSDGIGIALTEKEDAYYRLFSLWNDDVFRPEDVHYLQQEAEQVQESVQEPEPELDQEPELVQESEPKLVELEPELVEPVQELVEPLAQLELEPVLEIASDETAVNTPIVDVANDESEIRQLFQNADFIDAFEDDDLYECIEVIPEQLKKIVNNPINLDNNSFMMHGFFRFHHLLFGRVQENDNNTRYFIGIPGIYCNRERYMASVFGFGNFKKSHRSDYNNPYFGYWYQEI